MATTEIREKEEKSEEYEFRYRTLIGVNEKGEPLDTAGEIESQQPGFHYRTLSEGPKPEEGQSQQPEFRYRTFVSPKKQEQPQDTGTKEGEPNEPEFHYRTLN